MSSKEEENHETRSAQQKILKHSISRITEVTFKAIVGTGFLTALPVLPLITVSVVRVELVPNYYA